MGANTREKRQSIGSLRGRRILMMPTRTKDAGGRRQLAHLYRRFSWSVPGVVIKVKWNKTLV